MFFLETFKVEHSFDFRGLLKKAAKVATKKKFGNFGLPNSIAKSIYLKYKNVKTPRRAKVVIHKKDIRYENGNVHIDSLNICFCWGVNIDIIKINQIEIDENQFYISAIYNSEIRDIIRTYSVKHNFDFSDFLEKAKLVADYAVKNKNNRKVLTTKYVKDIGLPSAISNTILRKYSRGKIKSAKNVNLIVNSDNKIVKYKSKSGEVKEYPNSSITFENNIVTIKPLKINKVPVSFKWSPPIDFEKINQIEITKDKFFICISFKKEIEPECYDNVLGIDLNCALGGDIVNSANLRTGEILNLGKQGPNIHRFYFRKREEHAKRRRHFERNRDFQSGRKFNKRQSQKFIIKGNKEHRKMKNLDHEISKKIVNYAFKHKLKIAVENLKGIRNCARRGDKSKASNRSVNSWSFYRLQTFIEYKAKELGVPFVKVDPRFTSQECSYCFERGSRNRKSFICRNEECKCFEKERHADINAAFNIGKRALASHSKLLD